MKEFGIKLKIDGDISSILDSLKHLKNAFDTVEMPDKMTKDLIKSIDTAIQKVGEFGQKSESAVDSLSDSKEVNKAWKGVEKILDALQVKLGNVDATKLFPKEVIENLEKAETSAKEYNRALTEAKGLDAYKAKLEELNQIVEKQKATQALAKKAEQEAIRAEAVYAKEKAQWTEDVNKTYEAQQQKINETKQRYEDQTKAVKELVETQKQLQAEGYLTTTGTVSKTKLKVATELGEAEKEEKKLASKFSSAKGQVTKYKNKNAGKDLSKDQKYLDLVQKQTRAQEELNKAQAKTKALREQLGDINKLNQAKNISADLAGMRATAAELKREAEAAESAGSALAKQRKELEDAELAYNEASADVQAYGQNLEDLETKQEEINEQLKSIQTSHAEKEWEDLTKVIKEFTGIDLSQSEQDIEKVNQAVADYKEGKIKDLPELLTQILANAAPIGPAMQGVSEGLNEAANSAEKMADAEKEIENLKNQVLDFFSIGNSIQLFKRAITSAMDTVKELDATMTEAAVVTEFDIGDMWDRLPQYSTQAKELGVSINSMYEATTLYYQQGLKTNEAMELGVETMKMAKIAGMDSTNATKAMTSALRGFNMELNETSAQRVNDVYSQLAAVTAADTNQIATAMEKTASIAASANMEFETTAAFLSQIIETTQEAPETAGTALKTIIARFAEVKSLRNQGKTTGEDEEGEAIDVNKIQAALRTVGISMEGFFAGTEGLDSVLLKLAEKWGSLDFETQRYIATMAAGSRQQSRFIAMMSDYQRTTELVAEANNSAGASQKQYEKTLDSLETKLQNLKNAWDEFAMGLANNELLKAGVDILTGLLNVVNKTTEAISGGNGLVKSITSLAMVLSALKIGKSILGGAEAGGAMGGILGKFGLASKGEGGERKSVWAVPGEKAAERKVAKETEGGGVFQRPTATKKISRNGYNDWEKNTLKKRLDNSIKKEKDPQKQKELQELRTSLDETGADVDKVKNKFGELGGNIKKLGTETEETALDFDNVGASMSKLGGIMMATGTATSLLATLFDSMGMEEEAETVRTLGAVLMGLGTVLTTIGSFLPTLTGLTAAQAAATWAALWPILLVVLALGALIAAIVLIAKHQHDISLEGRMQAAAEATERAKEAAEGAKQAYDDLLSDKSEYDTLQEKLNTLTKGTLEWKQALADSNDQVLKLLDTYPELANYLTRGEHGELEITEKGWEIVQERQAQAVRNSNAAVASSQIQETKLQQEKIETNLTEAAGKNYLYGSARWDDEKGIKEEEFTQEQQLDIIYEAYKKDPTIFQGADLKNNVYSEALTSLSKQLGVEAWQIYKMRDALVEYDQAMTANEVTLQAQSEALLASAASAETNAYEYGDEIIAGFAKGASENQKTKEDEIADQLYSKDGESESENNEYFQKLMKENGLTAKDMTGDDTHDLEVLYAKMAGISREEIGDGLKGNKEALRDEIAKMQAAKEAGQDVDKVAEKMQDLNKVTQKEYAAMISGNIDLMDQNIITKYGTVDVKEVEKIASDLGLTTAQLAEKMGVAENELAGALEETAEAASEAFGKTEDEIVKIAGKMPEYLGKASLGGLKKYAALLSQAAALGTKDTIQAGFDAIFNSNEITEAQKSKIVAALDTFDWTKEGEGERFLEFLKTIGVDIEGIVPNMEAFTTGLKTVDALLKKIDAKSVFDELTNGLQEARDVADQDKLTNEQYFKYLKEGLISEEESGEWTYDGEGWVNVSNGMDNLVEALKANSLALYATRVEEAKKQKTQFNAKTREINKITMSELKGQYTFQSKDGKYHTFFGLSDAQKYFGNANYTFVGSTSKDQEHRSRLIANKDVTDEDLAWGKFSSREEYINWWNYEYGGGKQGIEDLLKQNDKIEQMGGLGTLLTDKKEFEEYDEYYSVYSELAELARQRERLEKQRNKTLQKGNAQLAKEEREKLIGLKQQEYSNQQQVVAGKTREINELLANKDYAAVIKKTGLKYENGIISFDETEANSLGESGKESFSKLLSELEGLVKQQKEAEDGLLDIELELEDLYDQDREDYINATNEIKQTLISNRQKEIDALGEVNDSINDANSKMIAAMQAAVDKYRQDRDNARTESDIEDKQRRLAYLRQDTSGANAAEIKQLEKEIEQDQETYTDSLIDQKIQELQDQNDKAAEQRERQIQILEALLEHDQESGKIWEDVEKQLNEAFDDSGKLNMNSELVQNMMKAAGFESMSEKEQEKWIEETTASLTLAKSLTGLNRSNYAAEQSGGDEAGYPKWDSSTLKEPSKATRNLYKGKTGEDVKSLQHALKLLGYYNGPEGGTFGENTEKALMAFQSANNLTPDGNCGQKTRDVFKQIYQYKTGGLADFTGPAWLDGTKSKPEYILNANQTRAFFQLVDVLSGLEHASTSTTQNNGDINLDIDINVETINDTADLDTISSYIEEKIVASANYRNNNIVGRSR